MTVEEIRGNLGDSTDNFPVGMRVLAVDDDPTCLMLLDCLLRKCQYQVTTTSQSRTALKMLRENRNRFDLIISDVYMPDMDGFKLLELVGLEMDLPVIMLSANSDPKLVMKGITHGACDYLVKPVRLEELRNIWQHVIRRKKFDPKSQNNSTAQEGSEGGEGPKKDDEEDRDDNGNGNEDSGTQKMPRFVWSIELHRKFVAAVDQLGIEKALPKRILDMMNVEGLTRENVASHLQKYRLYLNKIRKDASYLRMGSLDGLGDVRTFAASARLPNTTLSPYIPLGMLGRFNSPAGMNLRNLSSLAQIQTSHPQNSSHSVIPLGKCQPVVSPANQSASLFQGLGPLNQLQQSKFTTRVGEFSSIDYPRLFTAGSTRKDTRVTVGSSSNSLASAQSNPLVLQGNQQQTQSGRGFTNQSSLEVASLNSESFNIAAGGSSVDDSIGNIDQNGKLSRKKKDDEEDGDDNGNENEDSGTRSRPPVVWSIELHRKFVAAISQLGIEKALPERILDMMNVEGLTRENVASHLQKYRLHLKSIRSVASQQANMVAVLGGTNASYLRMGSPYRLGDFRKFASASHLPNTALSPYPPSGMLGRLDSPAGMNLRNFSSSALVQTSHPQNSNNSLNALAKFQPVVSPANQSASLFQGLGPLNQLQQSQSMSRIGEFSSIDYPRLFTAGTTFTDTRVTVGSSSNSLASAPSNPLMLQGNQQQTQSGRGFTNQSSLNSESRCNENWNNTIHFSKFPLNTLPLSEPVNHDQFPQYNNNSTRHIQNNPVHDSECREGLVGDIVQNMNQTQNQMCGLQQQDYSQYSNNSFGNLIRNVDQNNAFYNRRMGVSLVGQSNTGALTPLQHSKIEIKSNEGFLSEQTKPLGGLVPRCYDSLDDLMHPLMKREKDGTMLTDGEFGFDAYSFGSCICLQILVGLGLLLLLGLLVSCLLEEL